jgi:hypothetical protein
MSIVYDYLKQIQAKKEPEKVTPGVPPVKKSSGSSLWVKITVGILGCLLLGAGLYFFLPKIRMIAVRSHPVPQKLPAAPAQTPDFNFLLEGIIYNPSRPFAIIDGKMFEVGGKFGDFEIVKITPDTVMLKNLKDNTTRTAYL